jgi:hypothetical protein
VAPCIREYCKRVAIIGGLIASSSQANDPATCVSLTRTSIGSPSGADVILFGGNFANAAALGAALHINHFGLLALPPTKSFSGVWHEIGVYNDASNNAHIVDIAGQADDIAGTSFSNDPMLHLAVSDMAVLVGVNALSLTGDNVHFVT